MSRFGLHLPQLPQSAMRTRMKLYPSGQSSSTSATMRLKLYPSGQSSSMSVMMRMMKLYPSG